jgi:hypothetical protein
LKEQPKGPFCQSCSMPMEKPEDFGTDELGFKVNNYCRHCFQNGEFTHPDITLGQMTEIVVKNMTEKMDIPKERARKITEEFLPKLVRWKNK